MESISAHIPLVTAEDFYELRVGKSITLESGQVVEVLKQWESDRGRWSYWSNIAFRWNNAFWITCMEFGSTEQQELELKDPEVYLAKEVVEVSYKIV